MGSMLLVANLILSSIIDSTPKRFDFPDCCSHPLEKHQGQRIQLQHCSFRIYKILFHVKQIIICGQYPEMNKPLHCQSSANRMHQTSEGKNSHLWDNILLRDNILLTNILMLNLGHKRMDATENAVSIECSQNILCRSFRDHDGWWIGIARGDGRHHRGIYHPQSAHSFHPQLDRPRLILLSGSTAPHISSEPGAISHLGAILSTFPRGQACITGHRCGLRTHWPSETPVASLQAADISITIYPDVIADPPASVIL